MTLTKLSEPLKLNAWRIRSPEPNRTRGALAAPMGSGSTTILPHTRASLILNSLPFPRTHQGISHLHALPPAVSSAFPIPTAHSLSCLHMPCSLNLCLDGCTNTQLSPTRLLCFWGIPYIPHDVFTPSLPAEILIHLWDHWHREPLLVLKTKISLRDWDRTKYKSLYSMYFSSEQVSSSSF